MSTLINAATFYVVISAVALVVLVALAGVLSYLNKRTTKATTRKRGRILVWGTALGASTVLAIVVVFTQVPFYEDLFKESAKPLPELLPWLNLVFLTPIALESLAWVFTVMSVFAVVNNKPSARYERLMWALSSIAALVNAGHNISTGQAVTGLVLGGFSVAGPLMVHYALRWDRDAQSDWNADDFRRATIARAVFVARRGAQIVRHPINSWRTVSIATNLNAPWNVAYRIALLDQYDAVKAVLQTQFERALPSTEQPELERAHEDSEDVRDEPGADIFPVCTDPLIADLRDANDPGALFAAWGLPDTSARQETSKNDRAQDGVHSSGDERAQRAGDTVHGAHDTSADDTSSKVQGSARQRARRSAPAKAKRAQKPEEDGAREVVHAHAERQEHIAARHWWECTNNGIDPRARTRQEVANELGINVTAVSRGFKMAEDGTFPNPGEVP
ncbi:hypothetical protein [Saccharopolyspora sp. NPDC002376]